MEDIARYRGKPGEIDILEYASVIFKRKALISILTVSAFAVSLAVSLLIPKEYAATASVMPPQGQEDIIGAVLSSKLTGGIGSPDLWAGMLKSQRIKDAVIERFGLRERYGVETIDDARNELDENTEVKTSREKVVSVTVYDRDPEAAAGMANAFIDELDRVNKLSAFSSGKRMRIFIEERLKEAKEGLERADEELKSFTGKNRAVRLDVKSRALIDAAGELRGKILAKEVELATIESYAAPTNPTLNILKSEINGLREKLSDLERGGGGGVAGVGGGSVNSASVIRSSTLTESAADPSAGYARLLRDAKIQETLFELLSGQYEMARVQEAKDSVNVQVLDTAMVPEKHARPEKAPIVAIPTFGALFFSVFLAFLLEYLERRKGLSDA